MAIFLQVVGVFLMVGCCALWANTTANSVKNCILKIVYILVAFSIVALTYPDFTYMYVMFGIVVVLFYSLKMVMLKKTVNTKTN